jgi:hypothetical protein
MPFLFASACEQRGSGGDAPGTGSATAAGLLIAQPRHTRATHTRNKDRPLRFDIAWVMQCNTRANCFAQRFSL